MNRYFDRDVKVPCPECMAEQGSPCVGLLGDDSTVVHFGRRVKRIMHEKGMTEASVEARLNLAAEPGCTCFEAGARNCAVHQV